MSSTFNEILIDKINKTKKEQRIRAFSLNSLLVFSAIIPLSNSKIHKKQLKYRHSVFQ